ncbi:hypothetical protein CHU95_18155 [Niveispirillum lacus]|uniref:Solute-binding protein family 3/N-terminal domain-containing protein n=1 Tax=Niveispirillum lacus TaxID=1981099 RepID=A0A255YTZ7_9PROT|nr:PhnD/SsuA/transferrin family substrate-binding protein [Niveispirillum lacus]OYQ32688.1 hypothetical protein CHU95_18155 [Niveispirillum lacus]
MVIKNRKPGLAARWGVLTAACLALCLVTALNVAGAEQEMAEYFGNPESAKVTLAVPIMPTFIDNRARLQPAMASWLAHVAEQASVYLEIQPSSFDRRAADISRRPNHCVVGYDRVPSREAGALWLTRIGQDRILFVARGNDSFYGDIDALMSILPDQVAAPSGIYRELLALRDIPHVAVDDQRSVARMVAAGRVRFGMLIGATLETPDVKGMGLRIVAETPPLDFWFACSRNLPPDIVDRLTTALKSEEAEKLRMLAIPFSTRLAKFPAE